jgi:hypothetical protein
MKVAPISCTVDEYGYMRCSDVMPNPSRVSQTPSPYINQTVSKCCEAPASKLKIPYLPANIQRLRDPRARNASLEYFKTIDVESC